MKSGETCSTFPHSGLKPHCSTINRTVLSSTLTEILSWNSMEVWPTGRWYPPLCFPLWTWGPQLPVCHSSGTPADVHGILQGCVNQGSPTTVHSLKVCFIYPGGSTNLEFFNGDPQNCFFLKGELFLFTRRTTFIEDAGAVYVLSIIPPGWHAVELDLSPFLYLFFWLLVMLLTYGPQAISGWESWKVQPTFTRQGHAL